MFPSPPFLYRYYSASLVLCGDPTPHRHLTSSIRAACRSYSFPGELHGVSQVAMSHRCVTCQGLRPRGVHSTLPYRLPGCCLLITQDHRPTLLNHISGLYPFGVAFGPLPCLPTLSPQDYSCRPKINYWWLTNPFQGGFPPPMRHDFAWTLCLSGLIIFFFLVT